VHYFLALFRPFYLSTRFAKIRKISGWLLIFRKKNHRKMVAGNLISDEGWMTWCKFYSEIFIVQKIAKI